ncbi:MAG: endonuclease/exonuclease/phosphatase family protein [Anaerolineales bacterium]|nr:endonuclease/exonuclease/phosphatase family protein [Anaerolineales bacterium]
MGENLKRLAVSVCWVYAAGILGFLTIRTGLLELPPFLALINSFTPFLFLPLLVIAPLALWLRSKWAMIAGAAVLILFGGLYGNLFFPHFGLLCEQSQELRVMTFNLGLYLGHPEALMSIIGEQEADIVAVQEMTADMARLFEQDLGMIYPYMVLPAGEETTGLLSRYPILEEEWIEPVVGGRLYLYAVVDWDGEEVSIFAIHPFPPGVEWYKDTGIPVGLHDAGPQSQVIEVVRQAASKDGIVLIVGDFNMSDNTRAYADIKEVFVDAYREAGWGFGFTFPRGLRMGNVPIPGPLTRVDYIFHSDDLCTKWARVGCGGGSDHCYVVAQLGREDL